MATAQTAESPAEGRTLIESSKSWMRYRKFSNALWLGLCAVAALAAVAALGIVLVYLLIQGFSSLHLSIFTQGPTPQGSPGGGLRNAIAGSLVLIGLATCIGVPFGILGGVYQIESKGPFAATVRFLTDVLNSIPSIVIGIFVYIVVVIPTAQAEQRMGGSGGFSALAGGIALGLLMIPTVMRTTEEILRLVPGTLREGSLALGAPRWRTMWSIVLPAARGGIVTGAMLALSRVAGETAPLIFTAFGNSIFNMNIRKPVDSLPWSIYVNATSPYPYLHDQALAGAIILVSLILIMSLATRYATRSAVLEEK